MTYSASRPLAFATLLAPILASVLAPTAALAAGEPCTRDTECGGDELCLESVCTQSATVPECIDDNECMEQGGDICVDGGCKVEGVVCRNPAGECWLEGDSGHCSCADGQSAGWSGGFNPDDPPEEKTDAELQAECSGALVENCGSEAPTLPDSCVGDVLTECEALAAKSDAVAIACGEEPPTSNIALIGECCDDFDEPGEAEVRECLLALEVGDTCPEEAAEACFVGEGLGEPEDDQAGGDDDTDDDGDGKDGAAQDGSDGEKASCSVSGGGASGSALVWLGVILGLRARRRR